VADDDDDDDDDDDVRVTGRADARPGALNDSPGRFVLYCCASYKPLKVSLLIAKKLS